MCTCLLGYIPGVGGAARTALTAWWLGSKKEWPERGSCQANL